MRQVRHWLLTIPGDTFVPHLPQEVAYIKGQKECGEQTSYQHWQVYVVFKRSVRITVVKEIFGERCHAEATRSEAARDYVWKQDTRVAGTQFELGVLPLQRNKKEDWRKILDCAKSGLFDQVPPDVLVRYYSNIRKVYYDFMKPEEVVRQVVVYWGPTGVGKSRKAWSEAGVDAFPKNPLTKFWCGYNGHKNVVIDEFRGVLDVGNVLRWFDRYPCVVETKGGAVPLKAEKIWVTSNLDPRQWYPNLDHETLEALLRRLKIFHCPLSLYNRGE